MPKKFMNRISFTFLLIMMLVFVPTICIILSMAANIVREKYQENSQFVTVSVDNALQDLFDSLHQMLRQINQNNSIVNFLEIPIDQTDVQSNQGVLFYKEFSSGVESMFYNNNEVVSIDIYKKIDQSYHRFSRLSSSFYSYNMEWKDNIKQLSESSTQVFQLEPSYNDALLKRYCFQINSNLKNKDNFENMAVISYEIDASGFNELLTNYYPEGIQGNFYILTKEGELLFDSSGNYQWEFENKEKILQEQPAKITYQGKVYHVNYSSQNELSCIVCHVIPDQISDSQLDAIQKIIVLALILAIILTICLTILMNRSISKRIKNMMYYLSKIREGQLSLRIPETGEDDEIRLISTSINNMCERLEEYIQKVYIAKLQQKDAEIKLKTTEIKTLQAQINPHFLYNTLEIIRMKLNGEGERESASMILILSKLFRSSLNKQAIVTVGEEVQLTRLFIKLYQLSYKNIKVNMEIDETVLRYVCVRNTFQPILENCITHGYTAPNPLNVYIRGKLEEGKLVFSVEDDGRGIEPGRLKEINKGLAQYNTEESNHIGLFNVSNRLHLIFGETANMYLKSSLRDGTSVFISYDAIKWEEYSENVSGNDCG